jgi:hypothetical protein
VRYPQVAVRLHLPPARCQRAVFEEFRQVGTADKRSRANHGETDTELGAFVNPWFLAVAAFFGAGLTFAGATGTCGLARLLFRMPRNRPIADDLPPGATGAAPMTSAR